MEDFIARVFLTRNMAHEEHWKTGSYAQHEALGGFYDGIIEKMDCLVETSMGINGVVGQLPPQELSVSGMIERLQEDVDYIEMNRMNISQGYRSLDNVLDEISALYSRTLFKLRQLK